jgi:hypothetical protein
MINDNWVGITAKTLTPFYYHGFYARDGSATSPDVITDTALVFSLRSALTTTSPLLRSKPDYKTDLLHIPWRASLLLGEDNEIIAPVHHIIDVSREGGYQYNIRKNMGSGYFKNRFFVHEVAAGAIYHGILVGLNPFEQLNIETLVVRIGVGKLGILEIFKNEKIKKARLNTATAKLFGRNDLKEAYRIIDTIRVSELLPLIEVIEELRLWY